MKIMLFFLSFIISVTAGAETTQNSTNKTANSHHKSLNTDNEILAFLIVLNNNEISAANISTTKKIEPAVREYAELMIKEHTQNLQDTLAISKKEDIAPVKTDQVNALEDKGKKEIIVLTPLTKKDFEQSYIKAMIQGHIDALLIINNSFLKKTNNPQLKQHLRATSEHIAHHLEKAKETQKIINSTS